MWNEGYELARVHGYLALLLDTTDEVKRGIVARLFDDYAYANQSYFVFTGDVTPNICNALEEYIAQVLPVKRVVGAEQYYHNSKTITRMKYEHNMPVTRTPKTFVGVNREHWIMFTNYFNPRQAYAVLYS